MWPGAVAAEGDHAVAGRLGDEDLHAGHHALERALHRLQSDGDGRVLPEEDVMLEIDRRAADIDGQDRDQLAVEVVGHAAERFGRGLCGEKDGKIRHGESLGRESGDRQSGRSSSQTVARVSSGGGQGSSRLAIRFRQRPPFLLKSLDAQLERFARHGASLFQRLAKRDVPEMQDTGRGIPPRIGPERADILRVDCSDHFACYSSL